MIRVILNGKKADLPEVRKAITQLRDQGHNIEVRVTWEQGDVHRLIEEATGQGVRRIVAGGGDGTVNEVVDAIARLPKDERPESAILPLGTANDFATSCQIPIKPYDSLKLALEGQSVPIDIVKANDDYFINMATGGFGAQVTTETPTELKNFLGGGAYTLTGIIKALDFTPDTIQVRTPDINKEFDILAIAICNGRQAGGGQQMAPDALINDGLLDITLITHFPLKDVDIALEEILSSGGNGQYIKKIKTPWIELTLPRKNCQMNLDGEPVFSSNFRFEVIPNAVKVVLPKSSPMLASHNSIQRA